MTAQRASNLDNLDTTISSRADAATQSTIASEVSSIKDQTDQLQFTGSNLNVNVQVNSDKTGYTLTSLEHTNISGDVWNAVLASYQEPGSTGKALNDRPTAEAL